MALSLQDRLDITELLSQHGHFMDSGELDRLDQLFTDDIVYDLADLGMVSLYGLAAIRDAALALGDLNPVGHHITNVVVTQDRDGTVRVRSKGIGISADGTARSVVYDDTVTRGPGGWRIAHRTVLGRHRPLAIGR
ncbi:nuclear transport factor 2 family protein [Nocardia crassostreae]|uniref:nuclear transport factor 2 family protein n=1 Tax=Nocardia crassostreae TaxID=53428 RepID=UPI000833EE50|nr:nuclear transport factor 2 family protein [Nocardia crassostreae]